MARTKDSINRIIISIIILTMAVTRMVRAGYLVAGAPCRPALADLAVMRHVSLWRHGWPTCQYHYILWYKLILTTIYSGVYKFLKRCRGYYWLAVDKMWKSQKKIYFK